MAIHALRRDETVGVGALLQIDPGQFAVDIQHQAVLAAIVKHDVQPTALERELDRAAGPLENRLTAGVEKPSDQPGILQAWLASICWPGSEPDDKQQCGHQGRLRAFINHLRQDLQG
ncbi:MAG: hypothetical protein E5V65_10625 [Mesorhizobium sp.]|nr:MAG: hypothetical protein E5V65_10625 [Mesorhizobium sp.]